jgi:hypothetical protein
MAFDTFIAYAGVYPNVDDALADYDAVKRLHTEAGLVVVGASDMGAKIDRAMSRAEKKQAKELKADQAEIEKDAKAGGATVGATG